MGNKLTRAIKRERGWVIREDEEIKELNKEIVKAYRIITYLQSNQVNEAKKEILQVLLKKEKKKIKKEERRISRFEWRIHTFRKRIDQQIEKLFANRSINEKNKKLLEEIRLKIDANEAKFLQIIGLPNGLLVEELDQKEPDWNKIKELVEEATEHLEGLLITVSQLRKIWEELSQKNKEKKAKNLITEEYSTSDVSFDYKLFFNAQQTYASIIADINKARRSIYIESYLFDPDNVGKEIAEALINKAREFKLKNEKFLQQGKKPMYRVIIMFDGIGSPGDKSLVSIFQKLVARMQSFGVEVHIFNPPKKTFTEYEAFFVLRHPFVSLLSRNHRKLTIIDGEIAYFGGMNFSEDYYTIRDTHIRVTGLPVLDLMKSFLGSLALCKKYEYHASRILSRKRKQEKNDYKGTLKEVGEIYYNHTSGRGFKVVSNAPSLLKHEIRNEYIRFIDSAEKSIRITNPYFIPGWIFVRKLAKAAKRGVKVEIILSAKSDHPIVDKAARKFYPLLLKHGIKIYHYKQKGIQFVHAKTMVVDKKYACIGSSNLDYISISLNYELNVFFTNKAIAQELHQQFEKDLEYCTEFSKEKLDEEIGKESLWEKFKGFVGYRLLGPALKPVVPGYD